MAVWLSFLLEPLGAESLPPLCFWHLIHERQVGLVSPWINAQSNTNSNTHACTYETHIYKMIHEQKHKQRTKRRLSALDKQGSSGHSHTQHLRDGQLRKYARPSFSGSVNTKANISPAVIFFIFFTLLI